MTAGGTRSGPPLRLAVIIGSVRDGRLAPPFARWFVRQARQHGRFEVGVIDLAEADLPLVMPDFGKTPAPREREILASVTPVLARADAFAVVTPEYNHSFPAALKNFIDWHRTEWQAKPIGFVCYGGMGSGLRAVEHLRLVFAELHAMTVRDTVSFHRATDVFDEEGRPENEEDRNLAAKGMLDQIGWWAAALREARAKHPYQSSEGES